METMYSTAEVARIIGVNKRTLLRWLYAGEFPEPAVRVGAMESRIWTEREVELAKAYREKNYRKRS